jgi:glycyl-tRNA synthetase alpha subunit
MMPITPKSGNPELGWDVAVERANATQCTYWITVKNLTNVQVSFEGRFAILS